MDGSGKACHVLLRVNVYEKDDMDVRRWLVEWFLMTQGLRKDMLHQTG